ncbi:MAG: response regulator [Spirochaetales bacterium]|nr:response regulator [Spirochaetales bacterium]
MKSGNNARILIAEDNIDHLELLTDALSGANYEVVGTETREGLFEKLGIERFDVVILDYNLSKLHEGILTIQEIATKYPDIPVIIVTAYGSEDIAVRVMKVGAKDYVRKTLDNKFLDRIVYIVQSLTTKNRISYSEIKRKMISFFIEIKERFLQRWKDKIQAQEEHLKLTHSFQITDEQYSELFDAFVSDLNQDEISRTIDFLKTYILQQESQEDLLLHIELLNITFREIAHDILVDKFPNEFKSGSTLLDQINWIVDANDIVVSREYERIIDKSVERVRKIEKHSANFELLTRLRGLIYGPIEKLESDLMKLSSLGEDEKKSLIQKMASDFTTVKQRILDFENQSRKILEDYL